MTIQDQLQELWETVKTKRLFKFKNFFLDLHLFSKYDLRFIDPKNVRLMIDPLRVPDCGTCPQNCCHGIENTISLRFIDMAKLIDGGHAEAIDVRDKHELEQELARKFPQLVKSMNWHADTWSRFPILKRIDDTCPYLDADRRCTIYSMRPLTCRRYPYQLMENMREVKFSRYCINPVPAKELDEYAREHFETAIESYNEKIKDLILMHHAKQELIELGLGSYLTPILR